MPQGLTDAEVRRQQRDATGSAVLRLPTGFSQFDNLLGGLTEGLYLLANAPGMGQTTLALQRAAAATKDVPVVAVTSNHAPANLTLKLPCPRAGVNVRAVQRSSADLGNSVVLLRPGNPWPSAWPWWKAAASSPWRRYAPSPPRHAAAPD